MRITSWFNTHTKHGDFRQLANGEFQITINIDHQNFSFNPDIFKINETSVKKFVLEQVTSIDEVVDLDSRVRQFAITILKAMQ